MAFVVTARDLEGTGTFNAATETLGPFTPSNNSLLVVGAFGTVDDSIGQYALPATPVSGGPTFTTQEFYDNFDAPIWGSPSSDYRLNSGLFRAAIVTGSSTTLTVDLSTSTNLWYQTLAVDITGHDVASPIVQSAKNSTADNNGSDSVSLAVTLGATPATGNLVVVAFGAGADSGGGFADPTIGGQAMTQVYDSANANCQAGLWYRVITGTESNAVITCTDLGQAVGNGAGFAIEVAAAAGGSPQTWTGTAATIELAATSGSFAPGAVVWTGTAATVELAATSGSFLSVGIWVGSTATIELSATSAGLVPLNLTFVSSTSTSITMEWTGVWGAIGYEVRRDGTTILTGITDTQYTDSPLSPSTEYDHEVRAVFA